MLTGVAKRPWLWLVAFGLLVAGGVIFSRVEAETPASPVAYAECVMEAMRGQAIELRPFAYRICDEKFPQSKPGENLKKLFDGYK